MTRLRPRSQSQAVSRLPGGSPQPLTLTHSSCPISSQQQAHQEDRILVFVLFCSLWKGFPHGVGGKDPACQCRRCKRCGFDPGSGRCPSCLESLGQRSLVGYVHRVAQSRIQLKWLSTPTCTVYKMLSWIVLICSIYFITLEVYNYRVASFQRAVRHL